MENSNKNKEKNKDQKKFWISSVVLLLLIIAVAILTYFMYSNNDKEDDESILPYTELIQDIINNTVEKVDTIDFPISSIFFNPSKDISILSYMEPEIAKLADSISA